MIKRCGISKLLVSRGSDLKRTCTVPTGQKEIVLWHKNNSLLQIVLIIIHLMYQ